MIIIFSQVVFLFIISDTFFDDKRLFVLVNREEMTTFTAFPLLLHLSREIEHSIGYHTHDNAIADASDNCHHQDDQHRGDGLHRIGKVDVFDGCKHLETDYQENGTCNHGRNGQEKG